jgi:hypothetical protein
MATGPAEVQVRGVKEFLAYCKVVGETELPKQVRLANMEIVVALAEAIAREAPHGPTGRLAASVKPKATPRGASVEIGKGLRYAKPVIFGWKKPDSLGRVHGIKGTRFPYKVLDRERPGMTIKWQAAVAKALAAKA